MRGKFFRLQKLDRMGGHHRQAGRRRNGDRLAHLGFHIRLAGALDFDIESVGENLGPAPGATLGRIGLAVFDGDADVAEMRARQGDQAVAVRLVLQVPQPLNADFGAAAMQILKPGLGQQFAQL